MSLLNYVIRKLLWSIPVLFSVLTLTFILTRLMPQDPVIAFLPHQFSQEQYNSMREALGLNLPVWLQYINFVKGIFTGNWGYSSGVAPDQDVWSLIWQRFPRTFDITFFSMVSASLIGIITGVISARYRNKAPDTIIRSISLIGVSIPVFWLGLLLRYQFSYRMEIFPGVGYKTAGTLDPTFVTGFLLIDSIIEGNWVFLSDYLYHLILPVFCLTFITIASITRQTRSSMLEVLEQDYIRTARAKGCKENVVIYSHALKNALIPTITIIGLNTAGLLSGAVLTETTFQFVGMGQTLIKAINVGDYWVMQASIILVTALFIIINLITDVIYALVDPRIRF